MNDVATIMPLGEVGKKPTVARSSLLRAFLYQAMVALIVANTIGLMLLIVDGFFARFNSPRSYLELAAFSLAWSAIAVVALALGWLVIFMWSRRSRGLLSQILPPHPEVPTISGIIDDLIERRRQLKPEERFVADRLEVVLGIDERLQNLRNRTKGIIATIALSLAAGALVVLFAGRLTSLDASAVSNIDRLRSEQSEIDKRLTRLYQYQSLYLQLASARQTAGNREAVDRIEAQIRSIRDETSPPLDADSANLMITSEKAKAERFSELIAEAWKKEVSSDHGYSDWRYITATAITRVGVVLLIVYLVQILLDLYRYNTRLISYYSSRRDVLMLWDGRQRGIKSLDEVLSSSKIDFGKGPKHPFEDIIKALGTKLDEAVSSRKASAKNNRRKKSGGRRTATTSA